MIPSKFLSISLISNPPLTNTLLLIATLGTSVSRVLLNSVNKIIWELVCLESCSAKRREIATSPKLSIALEKICQVYIDNKPQGLCNY